MAQPIETHINAFYADLVIAKQEAAAANQRVIELEEAIVARGGELPDTTVQTAEDPVEDKVTATDVSAVEVAPSKDTKDKR